MNVCDKDLEAGDIFVIHPGEIADPIFTKTVKYCVLKFHDSKDKVIVGDK